MAVILSPGNRRHALNFIRAYIHGDPRFKVICEVLDLRTQLHRHIRKIHIIVDT